MAIFQFERGDTPQFTWVASLAPDLAPSFAIFDPSGTLIFSRTAVASTTTAYYALYTTTSVGVYVTTWVATRTFGGSAHAFVSRDLFRVEETRALP